MNLNLIENVKTNIEKAEKRPFDRLALGPFLIWYGLRSKEMNKLPRRLMVAAGIYQLLFAWKDYKILMKGLQTSPEATFKAIQGGNDGLTR